MYLLLEFPIYIYVTNLFKIDIFYFNESTFVAAEDSGYVLVNLTFSIELRRDTIVQFRYDDLTATGTYVSL